MRMFRYQTSFPCTCTAMCPRAACPYFGHSLNLLAFTFAVQSGLRSEEHTSELQSLRQLVCRLLLEKKKVPARETYTLRDMSEDALRVLRKRRDIACVLVNPLQALHPNAASHGDSTPVDSALSARFVLAVYAAWLGKLRSVCTEQQIPLILDEVFTGFRLAPGGAQEYFGVFSFICSYDNRDLHSFPTRRSSD